METTYKDLLPFLRLQYYDFHLQLKNEVNVPHLRNREIDANAINNLRGLFIKEYVHIRILNRDRVKAFIERIVYSSINNILNYMRADPLINFKLCYIAFLELKVAYMTLLYFKKYKFTMTNDLTMADYMYKLNRNLFNCENTLRCVDKFGHLGLKHYAISRLLWTKNYKLVLNLNK
jgi:hypothetical protein